MKKKYLALMVVFLCTLSQCSSNSSDEASDEKSIENEDDDLSEDPSLGFDDSQDATPLVTDEAPSEFIKMFYAEYLSALETGSTESVIDAHCTPELASRLANSDLDYDPFLNAQDFDENVLKTLEVTQSERQEFFVVSYMDSYSNSKVYVAMRLVAAKGGHRISDVIPGFDPGR